MGAGEGDAAAVEPRVGVELCVLQAAANRAKARNVQEVLRMVMGSVI
jgi:hypothetical protein